MLWSSPAFRRRRCLSPHVLQHLKGLLFPSEKILGQKKKSERGEERVLCCRKNLQSQTVLCRPGGAMGRLPTLLGLLDHTFAEVCHSGVFDFLLVQLILSPKE